MNNRYKKRIVLFLGLVVLMGFPSCQVLNRYRSPEIDSENLFRDENPLDTTTIANIPWREFFTDTFLQSYIDEALINNFDMLIAEECIKQAEAVLGMARAAYFPDIALNAQVTQTRLSNRDPLTGASKDQKNLGYHSENYSLGIVAGWELDLWGKMRSESRSKYAQMLNSYAGRNLLQTSLISNIANTYYALVALDEQLKVTNDVILLMEENLVTTQALKEAGMTNEAAVEQVRAVLASARTSVPDLESNIRQLENAICTMLGRKPSPVARAAISEQRLPEEFAHGIPAQMLSRRPDVNRAELQFRSAYELTNVAKASFYPTISLTSGVIGYSTVNGLESFFKPENLFASIAGGLTQPIFARKQLTTQYKSAKSEQKIALLNFEKTVISAGQEVSDILYTYESSLRKSRDRKVQVEALDKAVYYTQELLKAGEANYLEVLTAQQSLLQAKLDQVSDKLQQLQSASDLYRALGGGVE